MTASPFIFCCVCGAANQSQATQCFACGQPVEACVEETALSPLLAELPVSPTLLTRGYRLRALVGKGGFGAVYQAEDVQHPGRRVALKQINLKDLSPQQVIEATDTFNREVGLLSGLAHPNLPRIYEHFADAEHWYLVMDFIEGETLEACLSRTTGGHLTVEEVLAIGIQLCSVLWYLHIQKPPIIFRDVKPANVMRTGSGHVYLIDFGIARRFWPGQRRDTTVLGSPGYAPPEQYGRAQTTVRSDIYSLGATLHCLLTGTDPSEETSLAGEDQEVPAALQRLLVQMLAQDATQRPPSMQAVKRALQRIQDEQKPFPGGIGGQILQSLAKRGVSRRTAIISLVGLAGFATLGGGVTLSVLLNHGFQGPHLLYTYGHSSGVDAMAVDAVAWSPDGRRIASGSWDSTVQVWDASSGHTLLTYRGYSDAVDAVASVAWSPNGRRIASGSWDSTVQVWDAATGRHVLTYQGHTNSVFAVAWSSDGRRIASASEDETVQVWDAATGGHVLSYRGHCNYVNTVAWSPDGRHIASGGYDNTVQVWDSATGEKVLTYRGHSSYVSSVAWSPDGRRIASGSLDVQVWDGATGEKVLTYRGHSGYAVFAVAWSPDGRRVASAGGDNTVQVWDGATGGNVLTYWGPSDSVGADAVAWSPDGKRIASGNDDGTVQVWSAG